MKLLRTLTTAGLTLALPLSVAVGLLASFIAQAGHDALPLHRSPFYQWLGPWIATRHFDTSKMLLPLLFVSIVMSLACLIVHHLRADERLNTHLRPRPVAPPRPATRKPLPQKLPA